MALDLIPNPCLIDLAEHTARNVGHTWIYLDTNEDFAAALTLYRRRGYKEIPRFNNNPRPPPSCANA